MRHSTLLSCLPILSLSALALGCAIHLDKVPVATLTASLPDGPGLAPGASAPLVVVAETTDHKELATKGRGRGKVAWENFRIESTLLQVSPKGIVSLPSDPRLSENRTPHLKVTTPSHPNLAAELDVPVRYDSAFVADFSGRSGSDGIPGMDGTDGSSGSSGSFDPDHPSAGGNGGDGTDGSAGQDGDSGQPGPAVHVWVTLRPAPPTLLQVRVAGPARDSFFLVDPQGGSLLVKADGGRGGSGGRGGHGGRGGSGGSGSPSGNSGRDGSDGRPGSDGADGNGGAITVSIDPQAKPYLHLLSFSNRAGGNRRGAAAALWILEEPVPPLW